MQKSKDNAAPLSKFERDQLKMRSQIAKLEAENLKEKSWQLQGETLATARPENALLEEHVDFLQTAKLRM